MSTFLSLERTQLSWIRTALSFVSFGFTIAKFFEAMQGGEHPPPSFFGPRELGIFMIAFGMVGLLLATVQHAVALKTLRRMEPALPRSLTMVGAVLTTLLGFVALVGAVIRN